jgi:hypothetical protein
MTPHVAATVRAGIAGLVVVASATIAAAQTAAPTFNVQGPFDIAAPGPRDAVAADFDRDGDMDLLVTTGLPMAPTSTHKVTLMANNGTGQLTPQTLATVAFANSAVASDFNGDGATDIAVSTTGGAPQCGMPAAVAIYLGNPSTGTPMLLKTCVMGFAGPISVQAGNFNADAIPDLAVMGNQSSGLRIFIGLGDGTFGPGQSVASSNVDARDMAAPVHLNNDAFLDLVVGYVGGFRAFLGRGDGAFDIGPNTVAGGTTVAIAAGDVTGDGIADLVEGQADRIRIDRGIGNGSFIVGPETIIGPGLQDLALVDLNGDGALDVAIAGAPPVGTRLLLNNGTGGFVPSAIPPLGAVPIRVSSADWNGDGNSDVAGIDAAGPSGRVTVALQNAPERIPPTVEITSPADGSMVSGVVSITAMASDNVGVTRVEFFANGASIGSSTGPDFIINWDASALAGAYTITARAFDAAGNSAVDGVSVNVADTAAPSVPAGLTASIAGKFDADFTWMAATDNLDVHHYRLYELDRKSGLWEVVADNIIGTSAGLEGIKPRGQLHTFAVSAVDAAGNESALSAAIAVSLKP